MLHSPQVSLEDSRVVMDNNAFSNRSFPLSSVRALATVRSRACFFMQMQTICLGPTYVVLCAGSIIDPRHFCSVDAESKQTRRVHAQRKNNYVINNPGPHPRPASFFDFASYLPTANSLDATCSRAFRSSHKYTVINNLWILI